MEMCGKGETWWAEIKGKGRYTTSEWGKDALMVMQEVAKADLQSFYAAKPLCHPRQQFSAADPEKLRGSINYSTFHEELPRAGKPPVSGLELPKQNQCLWQMKTDFLPLLIDLWKR